MLGSLHLYHIRCHVMKFHLSIIITPNIVLFQLHRQVCVLRVFKSVYWICSLTASHTCKLLSGHCNTFLLISPTSLLLLISLLHVPFPHSCLFFDILFHCIDLALRQFHTSFKAFGLYSQPLAPESPPPSAGPVAALQFWFGWLVWSL